MKLSLVIPAWNEAESLPLLFEEIRIALSSFEGGWEAIVVDDGSTDNTFGVVRLEHEKDSRFRGIRLRSNSGKATGLAAGFIEARGSYVVTMDADLQDDPQEILPLLKILDEGYDLVSGWKQIRNDPVDKTLPSKLFNAVVSRVSGVRLHDFNCGLKAYRAEVLPSLKLYGQMHRFLPVMAHWSGFKVTEKAVNHRARQFGQSKYGFWRLFHGLFDVLTLYFVHRYLQRPLHLFGSLGLACFAMGALPVGYFAWEWLFTGQMHVRPLLVLSIAGLIMGVQFLSLGLLAEMIQSRSRTPDLPIAERL